MPDPLLNHLHHDHGPHNLLAEARLVQQLEGAQRGPRVGQELGVLGPAPVLQVVEVGYELRAVEHVVAREVVQVPGVAEQLDELEGLEGRDGAQGAHLELEFEAGEGGVGWRCHCHRNLLGHRTQKRLEINRRLLTWRWI